MVNQNSGWLAQSGGIVHTADGGATWTGQLAPGFTLWAVAAVDAQHAFAAGENGALFYTTNGGATWLASTSPTTSTLYDLFMLNATTGWAVGDGGVILRTQNGHDWLQQSSNSTANLRGVHFLDASRGWVAGSGGAILRTTDGGATWFREDTPFNFDLRDIGCYPKRCSFVFSGTYRTTAAQRSQSIARTCRNAATTTAT